MQQSEGYVLATKKQDGSIERLVGTYDEESASEEGVMLFDDLDLARRVQGRIAEESGRGIHVYRASVVVVGEVVA